MANVTFADVVHQSISFSTERENEALVLRLLDSRWVQRLRDISQTANTRLVYMFSEHSRFGHSLGVAYLACLLLEKLSLQHPEEVRRYRTAVSVAALLHDIGHIAPGSHTAFKTWFPGQPDAHESVSVKIIQEDPEIREILSLLRPDLTAMVQAILSEDPALPPWTWQILSGGGWNVDRGNWCVVDSILGGVSYGEYNIPALLESIVLTPDKHLALGENRLDAMMHFSVSRHAMYRQVYQHRVILSSDMLNRAIVQRARHVRSELPFCDETMRAALDARSIDDLTLEHVFHMREPWWRYHLSRWTAATDTILADLTGRLLNRRLLKTVRIGETENISTLRMQALDAVTSAGFDPEYYLHEVSTVDVHESDLKQSMAVAMDDGRVRSLADSDPLFGAMVKDSRSFQRTWLAMPEEAKAILGRRR